MGDSLLGVEAFQTAPPSAGQLNCVTNHHNDSNLSHYLLNQHAAAD
jgi:hypothetical protein